MPTRQYLKIKKIILPDNFSPKWNIKNISNKKLTDRILLKNYNYSSDNVTHFYVNLMSIHTDWYQFSISIF